MDLERRRCKGLELFQNTTISYCITVLSRIFRDERLTSAARAQHRREGGGQTTSRSSYRRLLGARILGSHGALGAARANAGLQAQRYCKEIVIFLSFSFNFSFNNFLSKQ